MGSEEKLETTDAAARYARRCLEMVSDALCRAEKNLQKQPGGDFVHKPKRDDRIGNIKRAREEVDAHLEQIDEALSQSKTRKLVPGSNNSSSEPRVKI